MKPRNRGSAALELALLAPAVLLVIDLAVAGGRLTEGQSRVDDAAYAGARAASQAPDATTAAATATRIVATTLGGGGASCVGYQVSVDTASFHPGGTVAVDVTCDASLRDLSFLPLPGTHAVHGRGVSSVDLYGGSR